VSILHITGKGETMKYQTLIIATALSVIEIFGSPSLQASVIDPPAMIEVGAGAAFTDGQPLEALFQIKAIGGEYLGDGAYFILAKISGDVTFGASEASYLDFQFEALGYQHSWENLALGVNLIGADIQRDVQINNQLTYRITFLGLRGQAGAEINENATLYLKGAADLIGISVSRSTDVTPNPSGNGSGFAGEIGFKLFNRVRIAIGEKAGYAHGNPVTENVGYTCDSYWDDWGYSYQQCSDDYETHYKNKAFTSNSYLSLVVDLTENLSLFGKASYNLYAFEDTNGQSSNASNGALRFMLGVGGKF
jgi:hypothetical protein